MATLDPKKLKVAELRAELGLRGLKQSGLKAELQERLQQHLDEERQHSGQAAEGEATGEKHARESGDTDGPPEKKAKVDETPVAAAPVTQAETPVEEPQGAVAKPAEEVEKPAEDVQAAPASNGEASPRRINHILLDIEGTTSSISFVHQVLFPFALEHLEEFLKRKSASGEFQDAEIKDAISLIKEQATEDIKQEGNPFEAVAVPAEPLEDVIKALVENIKQSMKRDRKLTGLKKIQGLIWQEGYHAGQLKSHTYEEVPKALERWSSASPPFKLHIYSSGSIAAQKMLFKWTESGDLTKYLDQYFDTTSGPKLETSSYETIANALGAPPASVLFITDNVNEAKASLQAGLPTLISERPGNAALSDEDRQIAPVITSFDQVDEHLQ